MSQCPQCGAPTKVGQSFCGNCGANLADALPEETVVRPTVPPDEPPTRLDPDQPTRQLPVQPPAEAPESPAQQWGAADSGEQEWQPADSGLLSRFADVSAQPTARRNWLSRGNWAGAARTAGVALGIALVLGLVVAFAGADDLDVPSALWMSLILTANAFGANTVIDFSEFFSTDLAFMSIGQYPLLATFLALAAAAYVFRRETAKYARVKDVLLDALRSAVILSLLVLLVAIAVRIGTPEIKGYEPASSSEGNDVFGMLLLDGESKVSLGGALFLPFLLLLLVLAAVSASRGDWWTDRLSVVHNWLAAPLAGVAAVLVALFGAGLMWTIAQVAGEEDARGFSDVVRLLAVLPAAGVHFLGLGVLSKIGETSDGDDAPGDDWERLWDFADSSGQLFWLAPVAAVAIAAFGVWAVIQRSNDRSLVLRNVGVYLGSLVVVVPLLVRLANAHISLVAESDSESFDRDTVFGLEGFQTMALFLLLSAVIAVVLLVATGNFDLTKVKSKAAAFAQSVQTSPGQTGQPGRPGQPGQQWGGPPPGPEGPPPPGPPPPGPPPPGPPPPGPPPGWPPPPQGPPPPGPPPGWQPPLPGPPPQGPPPQGPPPGWQPPPAPPRQ